MIFLQFGHMVKSDLKFFFLRLILFIPMFSLPIIFLNNVFSLDVLICMESIGNIRTNLYVEPTDTHQYLLATSCHHNHTKRSIPYSQTLRILCICSNIEWPDYVERSLRIT